MLSPHRSSRSISAIAGHDLPQWPRYWRCRRAGVGASARLVLSSTETWMRCRREKPVGEGVQVTSELKERLETEFEDFARGGEPFGCVVNVDQPTTAKTHGANAAAPCEKVAQALARFAGRPRKMGRWARMSFWSSRMSDAGDAGRSRANAGRVGQDGRFVVGGPYDRSP